MLQWGGGGLEGDLCSARPLKVKPPWGFYVEHGPEEGYTDVDKIVGTLPLKEEKATMVTEIT